jgi:hypothetical protein
MGFRRKYDPERGYEMGELEEKGGRRKEDSKRQGEDKMKTQTNHTHKTLNWSLISLVLN